MENSFWFVFVILTFFALIMAMTLFNPELLPVVQSGPYNVIENQ